MAKIYFTIAGANHYYGVDFLKKGMDVKLVKEPDNDYDKEAIKVTLEGIGKIGYVANSPYTVIGDCMSAGRIYDKIGKTAHGKVIHIINGKAICKLKVKKEEKAKEELEW